MTEYAVRNENLCKLIRRTDRNDKWLHRAYNLWQESPRRNEPPCSLPSWREGQELVIDMAGQVTVTYC